MPDNKTYAPGAGNHGGDDPPKPNDFPEVKDIEDPFAKPPTSDFPEVQDIEDPFAKEPATQPPEPPFVPGAGNVW